MSSLMVCSLCLCVVFWKQFTGVDRRVVLSCSQTLLIWLLLYKTHESGNLWCDINLMYLTHHHIWCPPPVSVQHPCVSSYVLPLNGSHCVCLSKRRGSDVCHSEGEPGWEKRRQLWPSRVDTLNKALKNSFSQIPLIPRDFRIHR